MSVESIPQLKTASNNTVTSILEGITPIITHLSEIEDRRRAGKPVGHLLQQTVKPCVYSYLSGRHRISGRGNSDIYAIIADLRRVGYSSDEVSEIMHSWRHRFAAAVPVSDIDRKVKKAFSYSTVKGFGCKGSPLKDACYGSTCIFHKQLQSKPVSVYSVSLLKDITRISGDLSGGELKVYIALVSIEGDYGDYVPNEHYYISYEKIAKNAGISKGWVKRSLEGLRQKGLITFVVGRSGKGSSSGEPTEIRRVFPVPGVFTK